MKIVRKVTIQGNKHPKCPFGVQTDLSPGIEKLFDAMNLCENSKSFIISINLHNIKNMIHLSNLELDELSSLFSRKDLRDSNFQDTIIKFLCLGKSFLNLIKEYHRLHDNDDISKHMIPTTFNEETEFLSDSNLDSLKSHYMTFYWKVRKDFLDYTEDSMSHNSLIGSTISPRYTQNVSCTSKRILRHQRYQRKTTHMIFTLRTSIMHFYPNLTLKGTGTMLGRNLKKIGTI
jgi:hypothetical protein